jgi:EmrB/QacA subfamily drug resistance transporter
MATSTMAVPRAARRSAGIPYMYLALMVVMLGAFMEMLDTTVVNIALPKIITVFNAPVNAAQFVLTGYMIALAVIMPATGYFSDTYGVKRLYLMSMLLFTLGSLACGLAWSVESLVVFRVIQGLGGGMLSPLGMTIIFMTVPNEKRGIVSSLYGLPMLIAPVIGPTLGGYIVEYVNWRFIFTMNLPVGIVAMVGGFFILRESKRIPNLRFDLRGFILSAVGFACVFYGLDKGTEWGWREPRVIALVGGGVLLLVLWVYNELTVKQPLIELRVLKDRTYSLATGLNFVVTLGMYASVLLLPLFMQNFKGLGAMETGMLMFPQAIAAGMTMPISGRLYDKLGPRPPIIAGLLLLAYCTWQLTTLSLTTPDSTIRTILILRGVAMGLVMMPAMTASMSALPRHLIARGSSLTNVMRQLFASFGTAIFVTLLTTRQTFHLATLGQTITPDLPDVRVLMAQLQVYLSHLGMSAAQAKTYGVLALYKQVALNAMIMSFNDCFVLATIICLFGIIPAFFLNAKPAPRTAGEAIVME